MNKFVTSLLLGALAPFLISGAAVPTSSDLTTQAAADRWAIDSLGNITWVIDNRLPHTDHIEMSGLQVSTVVRYGVDSEGAFTLERGMVWPMLRLKPNETHSSLMRRLGQDVVATVLVDGRPLKGEKVSQITLDGTMRVASTLQSASGPVELNRTLFPSTSKPAFCELYTLTNRSAKPLRIELPDQRMVLLTDSADGVNEVSYAVTSRIQPVKGAAVTLKPGESASWQATFSAWPAGNEAAADSICVAAELDARRTLVASLRRDLVLDTPDPVLNTMFDFAKVRGCESIYATRGGLMHGPGGESYYAAIWANDQAEYINPFFPWLGYPAGCESAMNSFRHFARWMNPDYRPIPSSIIAEGLGYWNGAGDRGDCAMIAYGAARYALARGDAEEARQLWPLIEWCLEYCRRQLNEQGVVRSDSDELEGRFPAGTANLCTSSLYYDALLSASALARDLGKPRMQVAGYRDQATALRDSIESYFGYEVEGFPTYRYHRSNRVLRAWICIPLTMGIYDRARGTADALFSPRLWHVDGVLTQAGETTFWDRSTLYALRGVLAAGLTADAMAHLQPYSRKRLLGEHVPYAVEAWPEGSQRHLSAESGLYCRVFTEGLFAMRPTGLRSMTMTPRLPEGWDHMALRHIRAFSSDFNVEVTSARGDKLRVVVTAEGAAKPLLDKTVKPGTELTVAF